jgi:Fe2+ or Zn2+ uptake regulation protein
MASKKLLNKITDSITTETKKLLHCNRCGRIYDVTNMTPEAIVKEGWTLHKYDIRYESILVCHHCTVYYQ